MAEQNIVFIHVPPHGSECCLSDLYVAGALAARDEVKQRPILLMSDVTVVALPHQKDNAGNVIAMLVRLFTRLVRSMLLQDRTSVLHLQSIRLKFGVGGDAASCMQCDGAESHQRRNGLHDRSRSSERLRL